jgi:hypothetical protein
MKKRKSRYTDAPPDVAEEIKNSVPIENDGPTPNKMKAIVCTPFVHFHKDGTVTSGIHLGYLKDEK